MMSEKWEETFKAKLGGNFIHILYFQMEIKHVLCINFTLDAALCIPTLHPDAITDRTLRILTFKTKKTITSSWLKPQLPQLNSMERKNVFM